MYYPPNIDEIREFARKIGIDVKYLLGEKYEDSLDLHFVQSLPSNIVFNVNDFLDLSSVKSLPKKFQFNVGGNLYMGSVKTLPNTAIFNVDGDIIIYIKEKVKILWTTLKL